MVIKVYRNWMCAWEPIREDWEKHREILRPLCVSGCIAFKRKEDIVAFFYDHGIRAIEEGSVEDIGDAEQLLMF